MILRPKEPKCLQNNGASKLTGNTYFFLTIEKHVPGGLAWRPDSNPQFWCEKVGWVINPSRESTTVALSNGNIVKLSSKYHVSTHNLCYSELPLKKLLFAETITGQWAVNKLLLSACSYITYLQTCSGMLREHRGSRNVKSVETMGWGAMLSNSIFWTWPCCYGHKLTAGAVTYARLGPSILHHAQEKAYKTSPLLKGLRAVNSC